MTEDMVHIIVPILLCCFVYTKAQLVLDPDTDEDVQLQSKVPFSVIVKTTQCYTSMQSFSIQYITEETADAVFDVGAFNGSKAITENKCSGGSGKYAIQIDLVFKDLPDLVGMSFKLKATNTNNMMTIVSRGTYTFPAPLNLTKSSEYTILDTAFTWTCTVPPSSQFIDWYRNRTKVGLIYVHDNGTCMKVNVDETYQYGCGQDRYTLTLPATILKVNEQGSIWRCQDSIGGVETGSRYQHLDIVYPPDVSINFENTTENAMNHKVRCTAVGRPNNITFVGVLQQIGPYLIRNITSFATSLPNEIEVITQNVSYQDMGTYYCLATNGIPDRNNQQIQTASAYFNVISTSAKFNMERYVFRSQLHVPLSVAIPFYSNPPTDINAVQWINMTKDSPGLIYPSPHVYVSLIEADIEMTFHSVNVTVKGQKAILNISSFEEFHKGNYRLRITNSNLTASDVNVSLISIDPPYKLSNFTVICELNVAKLSWTTHSTDDSEQQAFQVLYKREDATYYNIHYINYADIIPGKIITSTIENIEPSAIFNFKVIAKSLRGESDFSEIRNCIILENLTHTPACSVTGAVSGILSGLVVAITVLLTIFFLKRRGYVLKKEFKTEQNRSSIEQYDDIKSRDELHLSQNQGSEGNENRSTYEELQQMQEAHTYDRVGTDRTYTNLDLHV